MIKVAVLSNRVEYESLEGYGIVGIVHQFAEIKEYVVHKGSIAIASLEALQPGRQISNRKLQEADLQGELHMIPADHFQAAVFVFRESPGSWQIHALDIREF